MQKINDVYINGRKVGSPCYVIAEIGVNFNGDMVLAKKTIDAAISAGADAVKFQTFSSDEVVADRDLMYTYTQSDGTTVTESQYEMFKRLELPYEWHIILKKYAESKGADFMTSVADINAVDLVEEIGVSVLKTASENLINIDLLNHMASKRLPVILSTGMASYDEIDNAVSIFKNAGCEELVILHCVSSYPTPFDQCNLNRIKALRDTYGYPVGFSDHTEGWEAPMLAAAAGACMVEKHFTLDKNLPGPDHRFSTDPAEFAKMVQMIRKAETIMGKEGLHYADIEAKGRDEYRRSIVSAHDLKKGTVLTLSDITYKRPGYGMKPYERDRILGKKLNKDIPKTTRLSPEDFDNV
ncbi:N-acylneuraminate-9-phosphate synthase [Denitrovibrio acetiphilus DSM 12809]|uniref:N-acylneuraminate-9-phosphate synthase n=1 Tax=Denitrovibrio acetiphilus (strain DSM 12809 / NBRC 114555 / N2460) TaxID=522772 RepID=D4H3G4_DENA2|nr:N-acetylneuraminate synthase family protein [Denitrovibrio acetiphilus]ADD67248.1 N-acylneuraminate-9-phosphate synthase [Denitrovibrio acetiphilus DSM 12809]